MAFPQEVERIRLDAFDIGEPIPAGIRPGQRYRFGRNIDGFDVLTPIGDLNGKSSGIAECIERAPPRVTAGGAMVIALIQIRSRLLTAG